MNRLKAIVWLDNQFRSGQHFSRRAIEQKFDISPRTVHRYIDTLRKIFNDPIIYDDKTNHYYYADDWNSSTKM